MGLAIAPIHWPYRLYSGGWQAVLWAQLIPIFVLGLLLGYLVRETNSPWPSIGTHILNNLISNIVVIG
jgi:membrane protease YdiL (CAAX protease family)